MTSGRRWLVFAVVIGGIALAIWFFRGAADSRVARPVDRVTAPKAPPVVPGPAQNPAVGNPARPPVVEGESRLADALNAAGGTVQRDLQILNEVFEMWQSNFPREGNPVGENSEITAALTGDNQHRFAFVSPRHPAINRKGELCDRWGTPFRFHQLSGKQMEIRSAGPDRRFGTEDDATWPAP